MSDLGDAPFITAQRELPAVRPAPRPELPDAPFAERQPAVSGALRQHFEGAARRAETFEDFLTAGYQQSVTGLATRGKAPEVAIDTETPWYGRLASTLAGMVGDAPAMVPGFIGGAAAGGAAGTAIAPGPGTVAGTAIGGFAGANALPAALRATMMEAYTKGEVTSSADFIERSLHVAWETTKAGIVGGATGGAGIVAKGVLPVVAGPVTRALVPTAAQIGTMATVGKGLEGQLPEPQDFLDAALVIGGLHGAGVVAGKLRTVYARTGKQPAEVVADAAADPTIRADLTRPEFNAPAVQEALARDHPAVEVNLVPHLSGIVEVQDFGVRDIGTQGRGLGSAAMRQLTDHADASGTGLMLLAQPNRGSSMPLPKLVEWYERHGFEAWPEEAQEYQDAVMMSRVPKGAVDEAARTEGPEGALSSSGPGLPENAGAEVPRAYQPLAAAETARQIIPGDKAVAVASRPFAELPQAPGEPARPTHVNYNYLNSTEDAKLALSRLSGIYEEEIQAQRRGAVSWDQTSREAGKILSDMLGGVDQRLLMPREPGTAAGAAEILARKQLVIGAAEDMMAARDNLLAKGLGATDADRFGFLAAIERTAMIQSEFLGARAEAGRALNIIKSTAMDAERIKLVQDVIQQYGKDPMQLADMLKQIDNQAGALKFARDAVKATTWEKVVEAWKAGILSGPVTHMANIMGNTTFAVLRAPIDATAILLGALRRAPAADRVAAAEPIARLFGLVEGSKDGMKVGLAVMKTEGVSVKGEQFRHAIEGTKGEIIRLPFRALQAEDAVFSTMNERAELYTLASRQATIEGISPLSREFRERVVQLVQEPPAAMAAEAAEGATRFTFNTPLGEKGQAVQNAVRKWHLEWAVPFIRTPGNIAKELLRMTPLAPAIGEWRADFQKGGAARDKAIAELAMGSAISVSVMAWAFDGTITGAGEPDPGKRRVAQAAGWQPYSIKVGDTYYSYQRLQPFGTLIGMAADVANVWDHMNEEESDKVPKMLSVAFANAITNQTFLQGITNVVQVLADPQRYGPKFVQQMAGSVIPGIVAQPTQMADPIAREVDSILDAVKARIPGVRQDMLPKRDIFGEPVANTERLGVVTPITTKAQSQDKVRTEAERLGVSVADTPKKTHIGAGTGKLGDVKLTPEERDKFADIGGHLAHDLLADVVSAPGWEKLPDMVQQRVFNRVFSSAHRAAALQAIPLEKRLKLGQEITEKVIQELTPEEVQ